MDDVAGQGPSLDSVTQTMSNVNLNIVLNCTSKSNYFVLYNSDVLQLSKL